MPVAQYRVGRKDGPPDFFLATTSGSGEQSGNYTMALADSFNLLGEKGITVDYWLHCKDCHVDDARNFMVRQFMMSQAPLLVFIDDDVGWDAENLVRLVTFKDADIVAGVYPLKQDKEDYPVRILDVAAPLQAREDGLLEVAGAPTGFMGIRRHVLEAMCNKRRFLEYQSNGFPDDEPKHPVVFERTVVAGARWSGDLNFCREARDLGFKVWVDPEMNFTHEGRKRWHGNLGRWLRNANGVMDHRLDEAFKRLAIGDASRETFVDIHHRADNPYAADPKMIEIAYQMAERANGPILEIGSGLTSIAMGMAVQRTGQVVHTLEHDVLWWRNIRNYLKLYALRGVHLYYAPMQEYRPDLVWYEIPPELPEKPALVVIDGPPRAYGRNGVFELLLERIKDADWIVDDMDDAGQLALLKKYADPLGKKIEIHGKKPWRQFAVVTS